ncbi:MAG: aminopeptidase [Candidatus Cloacimonadaceae bacterium]|nr:aminopeptidase [Candidatus Cloacimonadaceae bacterium]MDP3113749.1 aminopeptidase [Candidatus Cloacimonadaceae bacterium]
MKKKETKKSVLAYERKNFWKDAGAVSIAAAFDYATAYKDFLNEAKTVRETIVYTEGLLKKHKFQALPAKTGGKRVYSIFRNKTIAMAVIGSKPVSEGFRMVAAHIDTPRVDLKQNPLYEDCPSSMACMRTHYYGGIKKYQWVSTPLALHGFVVKADGSTIHISFGESDDEPVFIIPDLLPHLAKKEQYAKNLADAIDASRMNLVFSGMCAPGSEEKEAAKAYALKLLNDKYGITESDFISAELELLPANKARDAGFDASMVVGYGQDDRICAYAALTAMLANLDAKPEYTMIVYFADKEEVGSQGNTGAHSIFIQDFVASLLRQNGESDSSSNLRRVFMSSEILSGDVTAAIDPNYPSVHERQNAVLFNHGIGISKFTGTGGKYSCNDANAEFTAKVIRIFNDAGVFWQMGSLGKVDEGGGGTIAFILANLGAEVLDCGTGLMGMHSLYEMCSKADLYSTYTAYKSFVISK